MRDLSPSKYNFQSFLADSCTKDFCFRCVDYKACTEVCFRDDIRTTLKSVSGEAGKGSIIGVLKSRNHCSLSIGLGRRR